MQPAIGLEGLGSLRRHVEIADHGLVAANVNLPLHAQGQDLAGLRIADLHLHSWHGLSNRPGLIFTRIVTVDSTDHTLHFSLSVNVANGAAQLSASAFNQRSLHY